MSYENFSSSNQVVKGEYRLSAIGVLQVSGETMRHLQSTMQGKENLIAAQSIGALALQNSHTFILNSKETAKDAILDIEAISGSGVIITASFKSNNLEASKAKLFFAVGVAVSNLIEFYPRDASMALQRITCEHKKVNGAYIKSSYLAPSNQAYAQNSQNLQNPQQNSYQNSYQNQQQNLAREYPKYTPKPIPYKYVNQEEQKSPWRDSSLDSWHNPYAPNQAENRTNDDGDWNNPYASGKILDEDISSSNNVLDDWKNPYEKSEPVLESSNYGSNPLDERTYPQEDFADSNSVKINFLDPLAEMLGTSEISLPATFLGEYNIRGLKQALINKYPQWRDKFSSSSLMFSVNRQVSMSEFDAVNGGAAVTIFING